MEFCFLFNLEMIKYLYLPHVFRLVATIHHCKTAFLCFMALLQCLITYRKAFMCVFKKSIFLMTRMVEKWIHLVKNMQLSGL